MSMRKLPVLMVLAALIFSITVSPASAASAETGGDDAKAGGYVQSDATMDADGNPATAVAYVNVTVVPYKPKLRGLGVGMFTNTDFDVSGFAGELWESFSALLGL